MPSILLTTLLGFIFWTLISAQALDNACGDNEFCTYQCHCNISCQGKGGFCPSNGRCDKEWFGLRCQYKDLATISSAIITIENQRATTLLTDRDDSTCYTNVTSVTVFWDKEYPFTWLRLVMTDIAIVKVMYRPTSDATQTYKDCVNQTWSRLGQGTVDIRCEDKVMMKSLKVGGNMASLCSLYISGGRNVAYGQSATQSSTYSERELNFTANLAVDGNTNKDFKQNSCTHTNDGIDTKPIFTLRFNEAYIIWRFLLYNREFSVNRLQRFRLVTLDVNNGIVDNFKDTSVGNDIIYFINGRASNAIKSLSLNETYPADSDNSILTLCELEAFGECPRGKWSLPCTKDCSMSCPTSCHRDDGACNTVCAGYSNPPECTKACLPTKWGINCANDCSSRCAETTCDSKTGLCDRGCLGYSDPPYCTLVCANGTYGDNCLMNCSLNCVNENCNAINGYCTCKAGYERNTCVLKSGSTSGRIGNIVGPIAAGIVLILIVVLVVFICWRKKKNMMANKPSAPAYATNGQHNFVSLESINNAPVTPREKNDQNEELKDNTRVSEAETTLIAIEYLNSYIYSKDEDFYIKQFERIPVVKNVTQDVGLSKENKIKNRYKNICPYDHSRVHLENNTETNEMDYINASYIKNFDDRITFIAAQGPQKATLSDFIRMLWEQKVDVVVMLTDLIEGKKVKCEQYWPDSGKVQVDYIKVKLGSTQVFADYTIRKLELSKKGEATHIFTQFHFTSWPDKGVPSTQWSLVDVEQRVTAINTSRPIVVHCSAGVGRTGTFIALYNIMRQAEETGCVDFFKTVAKLREDRIFMVQTVSQYEFLHKAAQVAIACMRTTLNIHDFTDRLKVLEEKNFTGLSKMEAEFNGLCAILERPAEKKMEDDLKVYENADKSKPAVDYELDHIKKSPEINILFLPSYKHRDENILVKLPTTKTEAEDFWNLVLKYDITLIVSFDVDIKEKKSMCYLPTTVEEPLNFPCIEIKLKESNQKKLWIEQTLNFHSHKKTANASPSNKIHTDTITVLKCSAIELEPKTALEILKKARQCNAQTGGIIIYMCSDGVSQSGFMAVLSILLDRVDNESLLSIPLIVGTIKSLQPKIIANLDLYKKLYHTVSRHVETSTKYTNMDLTYYQNANKLSLTKKASEPTALSGKKTLTLTENSTIQTDDNLFYANYV